MLLMFNAAQVQSRLSVLLQSYLNAVLVIQCVQQNWTAET